MISKHVACQPKHDDYARLANYIADAGHEGEKCLASWCAGCDADSLRARLGGRFNYAVNAYITPYAGAYYDHEFDGKARSSVNGVSIDAPDLSGGTGVPNFHTPKPHLSCTLKIYQKNTVLWAKI